ncbi:hypothetical protein OG871_01275 [Kitasatospora sp. NBC_00374]|uniref:hypothetical protein n=1 Tax=Kitasatospora sp. NBC_00374 TaxID=2975964 RepID=UPI0030E377C8
MAVTARGKVTRLRCRPGVGVVAVGLSGVGAVPAQSTGITGSAALSVPAGAASAAQDIQLDSWMEQLQGTIGDRPLDRVAMPGSHDAGTAAGSGVCEPGDTASTARINRSAGAPSTGASPDLRAGPACGVRKPGPRPPRPRAGYGGTHRG